MGENSFSVKSMSEKRGNLALQIGKKKRGCGICELLEAAKEMYDQGTVR